MIQLGVAPTTTGQDPIGPDFKLTNWDNNVEDGWFATLDAFLYPDPMASQDVQSAARRQCLEGPHVFIVGSSVKERMEQHGVDQFDCLFWSSKSVMMKEMGWIFPD